jgi:hypothetical protein
MLFSSISPNYERNLKDELFGCFKYIGIPFDILDRMPTRDRKFYIAKHNGIMEEEKSHDVSKVNGEMINKFTDMSMMRGNM